MMNWPEAIAPHSPSIHSPASGVRKGQFWLNFGLGLLMAIAPGLAPMPALAQDVQVEPATFPVMKPGRSRQLRASWGGNDGRNSRSASGGKAWYFEKPEFFYTTDSGCFLGGRSSGTLIQNNQQLRGTIRTLWEGENAETLVTGTIEGDRIQLRYERGFAVVMAGRLEEGVFRGTAIGCGGLRGEFAVAPMEPERPGSAPTNGGDWGPPAGDRPGSGNFW